MRFEAPKGGHQRRKRAAKNGKANGHKNRVSKGMSPTNPCVCIQAIHPRSNQLIILVCLRGIVGHPQPRTIPTSRPNQTNALLLLRLGHFSIRAHFFIFTTFHFQIHIAHITFQNQRKNGTVPSIQQFPSQLLPLQNELHPQFGGPVNGSRLLQVGQRGDRRNWAILGQCTE